MLSAYSLNILVKLFKLLNICQFMRIKTIPFQLQLTWCTCQENPSSTNLVLIFGNHLSLCMTNFLGKIEDWVRFNLRYFNDD